MLATTVWGVELGVVAFGMVAQVLFSCRFAVQWIVSEVKRKSVVPRVFWYFSIAGSAMMLVYGILRKDVVIVAGQSAGTFVYLRNLYLIRVSAAAESSGA